MTPSDIILIFSNQSHFTYIYNFSAQNKKKRYYNSLLKEITTHQNQKPKPKQLHIKYTVNRVCINIFIDFLIIQLSIALDEFYLR